MPRSPSDLFDRHHLAIFRYVARMTGSVDVAEDVTQEVFVRVIRRWTSYRDEDRESAWLFRIARNLITDRHRAASRVASERLGLVEPTAESTPELALDLDRAFDCLAADDRDAFLLRTLGGFGHDEIAELVGSTPAAVRSRIFRARALLRSKLASGDAPEKVELRRISP